MGAVVAILSVVTAVLALIVVSLLRSHADILRALHDAGIRQEEGHGRATSPTARPEIEGEGHALGIAPPDIVGTSPRGDALSVSMEASPRTLLAFLSSGCRTCRELWASIDDEGVPTMQELGARLVVVGKDPAEESPSAMADLQPVTAPTVLSSEAWAAFGVPVSPYFVLVDGPQRRVIGEGAGRSWPQVRRLLEQALRDTGAAPSPDQPLPRREFLGGRARERRADRTLAEAGILPGDPSLYAAPAEPADDA
ncbi:MAG: TlpA family protein disulfide reductase [Acidimicrobiales bacterium]